jgi:hypothetical protein
LWQKREYLHFFEINELPRSKLRGISIGIHRSYRSKLRGIHPKRLNKVEMRFLILQGSMPQGQQV